MDRSSWVVPSSDAALIASTAFPFPTLTPSTPRFIRKYRRVAPASPLTAARSRIISPGSHFTAPRALKIPITSPTGIASTTFRFARSVVALKSEL